MNKRIELMAAPYGLSPGEYIIKAYADRTAPNTPYAIVDVSHASPSWKIRVSWPCPEPSREIGDDTNHFVDAAAVLAGGTLKTPWIVMGVTGDPVQGALWRADRETLYRIQAEGLGTVQREEAPADWKVSANWENGTWEATFELASWPFLEQTQRFAVAIWRGNNRDRAGLKSVSPDWIPIT